MRLNFGLGKRIKVDRIEVRWPGGKVETVKEAPTDRIIVIREGEGIISGK